MPLEWESTRIVSPDEIRHFVLNASRISDPLRIASQWLEMVADYAGPAMNAISLISTTSPAIGILNTAAALIQSLVVDLINQGVYAIFHHNVQEVISSVGMYNLISREARQNLPPVATDLEAVEGANPEMVRDDQVEGSGTINFDPVTTDSPSWGKLRGYESWVMDIVDAFNDPFDSRRPIIDASGSIGGVIFLTGADLIAELHPLIDALAQILELSEFEELASGMENWEAVDLDNQSRLGEAAVFRTVRDSSYSGGGEKPDFYSKKLKDLFPQFGTIVTNFDALLDILRSVDVIADQARSLVRALELKILQLSKVFEELADLLDRIARLLVEVPDIYALWLPVEAGGVSTLQTRIIDAEARPPFGPASLLVGGGFFVTVPAAYNIIKDFFFKEAGPGTNATFSFAPRPGLEGLNAPEFVVSESDWVSWLNLPDSGRSEISLDPDAAGFMNRRGTPDATSRGVDSTGTAESVDGTGDSRSEGRSGGARRGSRRTVSGDPGDDESIGAQVGGMLIQRASWGTYQAELVRVAMGNDSTAERSAMTTLGSRSYYLAHVSHDVPRLEQIDSATLPLPSGLLIEGSRANRFPYSDTFTSYASVDEAAVAIVPHSAPSADLMRRPEEAGSTVQLAGTPGSVTTYGTSLRATPDHSGCAITNIKNPDGSDFDLSTISAGYWMTGRQVVLLLDDYQESFFTCQIDSIDTTNKIVYISPAIFTQPVAQTLTIDDLAITDELVGYIYQQGLTYSDAPVQTFSIFARSEDWDGVSLKGISTQFISDTKGPAYSSLMSLQLPVLYELVPTETNFIFNGGELIAETIGGTIDPGAIVEMRVEVGNYQECWQFFVLYSYQDTELHLTLRPATGDTHIYEGGLVWEVKVYDPSGTFQGYKRLQLEVPRVHTERTAFIPSPTSGSFLTLSHSEASNIQGWIVGLDMFGDETLTPVTYDAGLSGESFRLGTPGTVLTGRACVEVSDDLKTNYQGRIFQVSYETTINTGTIRIYPWTVMQEGGSAWTTDPGGTIRIWRAQWEEGTASSPIPTDDSARTRAADIVSYPGGKSAIPGSGEAYVYCDFYPSKRSNILEDGEILTLLYGTQYFVLSLKGDTQQARIQMLVGGAAYLSDPFDFVADDKLSIGVSFAYEDTQIRMSLDINDLPIFDNLHKGISPPIPVIDSSISTGAKIYVGSNGQGSDACFGRVANLTIEDSIP